MKTTTYHFAGINTAALAQATEGENVLVSYADIKRRPGVWAREILPRLESGAWQSVILDSGAFTVISAGMFIDADEYGRFVQEFGHLFDVVVNLDDIAGDLDTTHRNQRTLEAYAPVGVDIMPVFHQGEDWSVLEGYLARSRYIGVGFARKKGGKFATSVKERRAFLVEFFARVGDRATVHGFGMSKWVNEGFPFATADSTTWIAESCAMRKRGFQPKSGGLIGMIAKAFDKMSRIDVMRFVMESYKHQGTENWTPEAKGQAATPLKRFGHYEARRAWAAITGTSFFSTEAI